MAERTDLLRVALAQLNPVVGDIRGNARKISDSIARARDEGAALVVLPELALTGYPPEDLLLKTSFLDAADAALQELAGQTHDIAAVVGYPEKAEDVYNSAAVLADGGVVATYRKMYLPNYGVFDEQRYFQSGAEAAIFELNGIPLGLSICEDIWEPGPPAMTEALGGAQVILNLSASPYRMGVGARRERMLIQRAVDNLTAVVFVNTVGGQDELVFDGHSLAIDQDGEVLARAPQFEEALTVCTIDPRAITAARLRETRHRANVRRQRRASHIAEPPVFTLASISTEPESEAEVVSGDLVDTLSDEAEVYAALRTGLRDYTDKNGFEVLKDVYKTWVYRLVRWRNEQEDRDLVPASVLDRPPSAELRYDQRDEDSLPAYDVLDRILEGYIEQDLDAVELVHRGLPAEDVERVIRMVDRAEYKRRQAPPGIKISSRAFGRDRRLPITNRFETSTDPAERRLRALK